MGTERKPAGTPAIIKPDLLPSVKTGELIPRDEALDEINQDLVKVGHPNSPDDLSEDEEKRMGIHGDPIADGYLWSDPRAHSGLRLVLAGTFEDQDPVSAPKVQSETVTLNGLTFEVAVVMANKPRMACAGSGCYIELASDLGTDEKKQMVTGAWVVGTAVEIFEHAVEASGGRWRGLPNPEGFEYWLKTICNGLIGRTGL